MNYWNQTIEKLELELKALRLNQRADIIAVGDFARDNESDMPGLTLPPHLRDAEERIKVADGEIEELERVIATKTERRRISDEKKARSEEVASRREMQKEADEKLAETRAKNTQPDALRARLANLERQYQTLSDGPARRAMQGEIDRIKNQLA